MIGDIISAGANIVGGFLNRDSANKARDSQERMNAQNIALQREFAQSGIQWKVADAKAAGIHPIYALGGSTASFTPVSSNFTADTSVGNAFAAAGQDLGRAIDKTRTADQKVDAFTATSQKLQLENMALQNDVLRSEIASKTARLRQEASPPFPSAVDRYLIPGQANSGLNPTIKEGPLERVTPSASAPWQEPGAITDQGFVRTPTGLAPVPSKDAKERIEDNIIQEVMWAIRNNLLPMIAPTRGAPSAPAGPDKEWRFNPFQFEYQAVPRRRGAGELWENLKRYRDWRQYGKRY